jgi:hypothetical protein
VPNTPEAASNRPVNPNAASTIVISRTGATNCATSASIVRIPSTNSPGSVRDTADSSARSAARISPRDRTTIVIAGLGYCA